MQYISTYIKKRKSKPHTHSALRYCLLLLRTVQLHSLQSSWLSSPERLLPPPKSCVANRLQSKEEEEEKKSRTFGGSSRSRTPFKQSYNLISSSVIFRSLFFARRLERVIGTYIKSQRKKWKNHK